MNLSSSKDNLSRPSQGFVSIKPGKQTLVRSMLDETFLACLGFVCMTGSIGYFFIGGNGARYGLLIIGFFLVLLASIKRSLGYIGEKFIFLVASSSVFGVLLLIAIIQDQQTLERTNLIFQGVAFALFVCGYLMGSKPRLGPVGFNSLQVVLLSAVASLSLVMVLRFTNEITFYEVGRGFGDSDLNPVGLAYATAVLFFSVLTLLLDCRNLAPRIIAGFTCVLAIVILLVSGSRGATFFTGLTIAIVFVALLYKKQFSYSNAIQLVSVALVLLVFGVVMGKKDFAFFDRIDVFVARWDQMIMFFQAGEQDSSISARQMVQQDYLNNFADWIVMGQKNYQPYPHNQFIEWGARFGVLGLGLCLLFMLASFWFLWKQLANRFRLGGEQIFIVSLLLFSFFQSMTSLSLEINRALFFSYGYVLAMFVVAIRGAPPLQHRASSSLKRGNDE